MRILAIETSTDTGSVALIANGAVEAECTIRSRAGHSDAVLGMVDQVLRSGGARWETIDVIAAGLGPGSFTGARVGLATAKGLRLATDLPLIGVPTLDALAAAAVGARGPLVSVIDGKRGEVFAAAWVATASGLEPVGAAAVGAPDRVGELLAGGLASGAHGPVLAVGDLAPSTWSTFEAPFGGRLDRLASIAGAPHARFVAFLAATGRYARDEDDTLEPVYLRAPSALSLEEQQRLRERASAAATREHLR